MDSKVPLYISAVSLFVTVIACLFFFNIIQKMKKSIKDAKTDKNIIANMRGKVDVTYSELQYLKSEIEKLKQPPTPIVSTEAEDDETSEYSEADDESEASKEVNEEESDDEVDEVDEVEVVEEEEVKKVKKTKAK